MSIFANDAALFTDPILGGETITVYPDGVTPREDIKAMIERRPPKLNPSRNATLPQGVLDKQCQIRLDNNAMTGLALSELVLGKTKVRLAPDRLGGEPKTLLVHLPDDGQPWHDDGMIRLIVR
jgi:hypothetical protein